MGDFLRCKHAKTRVVATLLAELVKSVTAFLIVGLCFPTYFSANYKHPQQLWEDDLTDWFIKFVRLPNSKRVREAYGLKVDEKQCSKEINCSVLVAEFAGYS